MGRFHRYLVIFVFLNLFSFYALAREKYILKTPLVILNSPSAGASKIRTLEKGQVILSEESAHPQYMKIYWKESDRTMVGYALSVQFDRATGNNDKEDYRVRKPYFRSLGISLSYVNSSQAQPSRTVQVDGTDNNVGQLTGKSNFFTINLDFPIFGMTQARVFAGQRVHKLTGQITPTGAGSTPSDLELNQYFYSGGIVFRQFFWREYPFWLGLGYEGMKTTKVEYILNGQTSTDQLDLPFFSSYSLHAGYDLALGYSWNLLCELKRNTVFNAKPNVTLTEYSLGLGYAF